jgi:DNA-binding XRE family transcriptional regulator
MSVTSLTIEGKAFVILKRSDYEKLKQSKSVERLPALPKADKLGRVPAVAYARASLARKIITARNDVGWSQKELAERAGIRVETLCRIETGKHTPSISTIDKIYAVLDSSDE